MANGQERVCTSLGLNKNLDPGHDLEMTSGIDSWQACCERCKANPACKGFVHNNLLQCWLKYRQAPVLNDNPKWQTHSGLVSGSVVPPPPPPKPLVCLNAVEREEAVKLADSIAGIVNSAITLGAIGFNDPAKKAKYLDVKDKVFSALQSGWSSPGVCDSIANPIADPLKEIPAAGTLISDIVKFSVKAGCEQRKKELGC